MADPRQEYGHSSEALAARHLKRLGYRILEQNYRTQAGEIDIIAQDRDTLVFVEVKARRSRHFGSPKWAVNFRKQQKISMAALYYLKTTHQTHTRARFDVVSITASAGLPSIEVVKNAFELAYR